VTVNLWRIASDTPSWTAEDLAGKGAASNGARWNLVGERVTYASSSVSLAAWETRAHLGVSGARLPFNRFLVCIGVPDDIWDSRATLPSPPPVGWNSIPEGLVSRQLGSRWLLNMKTVLCEVPSVIIDEEVNVLINPAHPDVQRLTTTKVRRFLYDHRV
jgi:RES domain-containing protein